jgi:hypothetical protein
MAGPAWGSLGLLVLLSAECYSLSSEMTATIHATIDKSSDKVHVTSAIDKQVCAQGIATVFHVPVEDVKIVHLAQTMIRSRQPNLCVPSKVNYCEQSWFHFTVTFQLHYDSQKEMQLQLKQAYRHPGIFIGALNNAAARVSRTSNSTFVLHATAARIRAAEAPKHSPSKEIAPQEPFADTFKVPIRADIVVKFEDPITDSLLKTDPIRTESEMSALSRTDEAIEILTGAIAAAFGVRTDNMQVGSAGE